MNKLISLIIVTLAFIFVLVTEIKASDICEKEEKYSQAWYYNNCDGNILQSTDQKPIKSHLKQNPNELLIEHQNESVVAITKNKPKKNQVNLAENPRYKSRLLKMEKLLFLEMEKVGDPFKFWNQQ